MSSMDETTVEKLKNALPNVAKCINEKIANCVFSNVYGIHHYVWTSFIGSLENVRTMQLGLDGRIEVCSSLEDNLLHIEELLSEGRGAGIHEIIFTIADIVDSFIQLRKLLSFAELTYVLALPKPEEEIPSNITQSPIHE